MQPTQDVLFDLACRYRESNKLFTWTLIGGLLCVWPLLIVTFLEYTKMRDIKKQIIAMGIDPYWWECNYRPK
jgi:hypothetical protein